MSRFLRVWAVFFAVHSGLAAQNVAISIQGPTVVCPDCYQYRVVVTAPGGTTNTGSYSYYWTQASLNGEVIETANDSVVKFCFYRPGSYKVSVRVSTPGGLILGVSSIEVQVLPYLPLKIVSANASPCATSDSIDAGDKQLCDRVCPRSAVVYSVEGPPLIGPPANISWSVIGADSFRIHQPQRTSITVYWGTAGVGSVTVVFVGDSSTQCYGSAALCVTVVEEPQAAFEVAPAPTGGGDTVRICKGQTVWFDNRSQYAERYEWFFSDDLSVSYSVHAQHRFEQPGVFAVRLTAISGCRCTDTAEVIVEVLDAESPVLTCVGDLCAGAAVTYRAGSNCSGISWSISANGTVMGGGLPGMDSIVIRWNTGPVGSVWLTPQACAGALCPFPTLVRIPILDDNAQIEGRERVCPDAEEVYSIAPYGGTGFVWSLSGGGTIVEGQGTSRVLVRWSASPNPNNVYRLSVRYDNCYLGCGGKDTISVRILSPFYVNGPVEACEGVGANFLSRLTVNNQNLATHWTLTGPDGSVVWTSAAPAASVTAPLNAGGGYYRMRAVAANPLQTCTDMREWRVRVPSPPAAPSAIEGPTVICPGRPLTYTAKGIPAGNAVQWTVQNGPGVPQTLPGNPVNVTWGATGPYRLAVQAVSSDGLNCASATTTLDVQSVGGAALSGPDTVCIGETATYSLLNLANLGVQWSIKPDDAGVLTAGQGTPTATVYWAKGGVHALQATVCGQTLAVPIAVSPAQPATVVHPSALCPGQMAVVRAAQAYAHYRWSDASGNVLSIADSALLGPGHYVLEATDEKGCPVKAAFSIAHRETPYVTLSTSDPTVFCNPQPVTLQAVVNTGGGLTYEWFWNGLPVGGNTPTYTTNQFGQYTVRVTNAAGCSATAGPVAVVQDCGGGGGGFPVPGNPGPCPPNQVTLQVLPSGKCDSLGFQASGPDYQMGSAQWFFFQWGRGILATDAGDRVGRHFSEVGLYQVILTAKTTGGATCYVAEPFPVEAVARFSAPTVCVGEPLSFREESSHLPNSAITQWTWDFGDPASGTANTSTLREPKHTFLSPGTYAVRLTVTTSSGCTASASRSVAVQQPLPPTITAPPKGCEGTALLFEGTGENLRWNFGHPASGSLNVAEGSPAYHAFSAGTYTVTAIATDAYGCTATATQMVTVAPNLLGGLISPAQPAPVCTGGTLTLSAPPGADTYRWSEGSQGHTLTVAQEGVYGVTLTDANGCTYAPPAVPVRFLPEPVALIKAAVLNEFGQTIDLVYPSHSVCAGEDVFLVAQGQGNLTFSWSTGVSGTRIEFSRQRDNLLPIGTHFYTVTITDQTTGCTAVSPPFVVTVNPVPSGFFITNNAFPPCAGTLNTLQYNGPNPGNWQLIWNTGQVGAPLSTTRPGRYFLRVVNEFGCEARSNVLTVLPGPPVSAVPAGCHTRCRPDTLCMPSLPNVVSWQWFFNGNPIAGANSPALVPQQSGTYHAVLTDNYGCTNRSGPLTLELYDGFGSVLGQVWSDVNGNGAIDAGDTLVRGIPIRLIQGSATVSNGLSGANGNFAFANIPAGTYTVAIDTNALPPGWKIVIGQRSANLVGCDARAQGDLLLRQVCLEAFTTAIQMSACAGEEVLFNGTPIPAGSSRTFAFTSTDGCDSLVTVSVSAIPTSEGVLRVSACAGSFYNYQGTPILAGGSATFVLTNAAGCDSVLTVVVSEVPATSGVLNVSACAGGFYDYQGTPIPAGGSATFVLTNAAGCDSVLTVVVSEVPATSGVLNVSACAGGFYDYQGTPIPAGGSATFVLTNAAGCDSVLTVVVSEVPATSGLLNVSACAGGFYDYQGTPIAVGGSATFVLTNALGCDSVLTVVVSEVPATSGVLNVSACAGGFYDYQGTPIPAGGSATFVLTNAAGCDSVLTVVVSELPATSGVLNVSACAGGFYDYQGTPIPAGGSATFVLTNAAGCDSVLTVVVSELPATSGVLNVSACAGGFYDYQGTPIPAGGSATFVLANAAGCDSVLTVVVSEVPATSGVLRVSACAGSFYDYRGTPIPAGGSATFVLTNAAGCDSVLTVVVSEVPVVKSTLRVGACPGRSFVYQGVALPVGAMQDFVLTNSQGCDSIVTVVVGALPTSIDTLAVKVCPGEAFMFNGMSLQAGETRQFVFANAVGCDSVVVVQVSDHPTAAFGVQVQASCANIGTGSATVVQPVGGQPPYRYSLDGVNYQDAGQFSNLPPGPYRIRLKDANGCIFERPAEVPALEPLRVALDKVALLPCREGGVVLRPEVSGTVLGLSYAWSTGAQTLQVEVSEPGTYTVEVSNVCERVRREVRVQWEGVPLDFEYFYVPNVFAPASSDPDNSQFRPYFIDGLDIRNYRLEIFDRWGNLLFRTDDPQAGWRGPFRAADMQPAVFVWHLTMDVNYCGRTLRIRRSGDVTLVR